MKEQLDSFLEHLALNDNASAHTVRAYESDVSQFLSFLAAHLGRRRPDLTPVFSFNSEGLWQGVGGPVVGDAQARLSRWREVLAKAHAEGFF